MNEYGTDISEAFVNFSLLTLLYTVLYSIIVIIFGKTIFKKAKKDVKSYKIPFLNLFTLLEIVDMTSYFGVLLFIPILNFIPLVMMSYKLGKVFKTSFMFKLGLLLLPIIFIPLLSKGNYKYKADLEEKFLGLESVKQDNVNLLTQEDIKEVNNAVERENNEKKVDSIFKGEFELKEKPAPYKAKTLNKEEMDNKSDIVHNPFEPIKKVNNKDINEVKNTKKQEDIEFLEL